jgi:hypothetical protein
VGSTVTPQAGATDTDPPGMDISSLSGLSTTSTLSNLQRPAAPAAGKGPFDAVSSLLGMSADDIADQVKSGKSLDDLAKTKGVSHSDLVAALKAGAPSELQGTDGLDAMVEQIASQTGMRPMGPPPPPPSDSGVLSGNVSSSQQTTLDALSSLLDMSSDDLQSSLQNGTSLVSLLTSHNVDLSDLADTLQSGFLVDKTA